LHKGLFACEGEGTAIHFIMKKALNLLVLVWFATIIATFPGCQKNADLPLLTTSAVSSITYISASSGGNVTDDGGAEVDLRGVC
jgi:hypothetical protein